MTATPTGAEAIGPVCHEQFIPNYRIVRQLGQGGMGTVFEAVHLGIGRRVAIKVLHAHLTQDAHFAGRFLNEARAVNLVDHPGLVEISDYVRLADGTTFIVMEYLKGESLRARMERDTGRPLDALDLGRQIASALDATHACGIIHRDLKPDNIMLVPDPKAPDSERVKIFDFGIAKGVVATEIGPAQHTQTGMILGTPTYMAPEQGRGDGQITDRADVYSLGVILYQMLAGRPPFETQGISEMLAMHLLYEPPPLSRHRPGLDVNVVSLVQDMLGKDPARRPCMAQVVARLSGLACGENAMAASVVCGKPNARSIETSGPFTLGLVGKSAAGPPAPRRSPRAAIGAMTALLAGGSFFVYWMRSPEMPAAVKDPPAVGLRLLHDYHAASGSARSLLREPDAWEAAAADFARFAGTSSPLRWRSGGAFCQGRARLLRGDVPGATRTLRGVLAQEDGWPDAHLGLAEALDRGGTWTEAMAEVHRAEELDPTWWVPVATGAVIQAHARRLDEAIQGYRRALTLAPQEPAVLDGLALVLHAARLDLEAEAVAQQALERDPDLVWSRVLRAERALERSDGETALREATRAASLSPRAASVQLARADALALLHRDAEALQGYLHVLALVKMTGGLDLPPGRMSSIRQALAEGRLPSPRVSALPEPLKSRPPELLVTGR